MISKTNVVFLILAQAALVQAQTPTISVLALLKNQPQHDIQLKTAPSGTARARLENRQAFAREAQAASHADQSFVAAHLRALGASRIMRYTAVNAVSATLPAINLDALATDPGISRILRFNSTGSNNPMLDLLGQIDRTVTATSDTVVSASLPDGAADPDDALAQLIDRLIDDYQLTLMLEGGAGDQSNALTLAAGAAAAENMYKPDFVTAGSASALEAIGRLSQSGVSQPLAQKALLINTADSSAGWSPETGWGAVNLDAINALTDPASGQAVCVDQDENPQSGAASCFVGSTASTQYYETKSSSPAKLTLAWNRSFASDGTPLPRNFELHVYDRAQHELASAVSDTGNVLQVTAASDSGLLIKVAASNAADGSAAPAQFALASSSPVTSVAAGCPASGWILTPASYHLPSGTNNSSQLVFSFYVTVSNQVSPWLCTWTVTSSAFMSACPSYTINCKTGANQTVGVTAQPNTGPSPRSGVVNIVSLDLATTFATFTVTQDGTSPPPCTYSATATGSLPIGFSGGSAGIDITASPSTCTSSVSNDSPSWLTLSSSSNSGTWTAGLTAASNIIKLNASTPQRTANVVVTGTSSTSSTPFSQSFSITQSGLQCSFTVPSTPFSIPAAGIPQSQPQSFTVKVSNPACQWTASSGSTSFLYVVNDGVKQTGNTTYTVQYWAKPNTGTTLPAAYIQVGDQTYDGFYVGIDDKITITYPTDTADGTTFTAGDDVSLVWKYSGTSLKPDDKVTITTTAPVTKAIPDTTLQPKSPPSFDLKLTGGVAGTTQKYSVTVTDTTVQPNVWATREFSVRWPKITVTYPPTGKTAEARDNPDAVTWAITPAGADVGKIKLRITPPNGGVTVKEISVDNTGTYKLTKDDLAAFRPGEGYQIRIFSVAHPNDWFGDSAKFAISGIKITSPTKLAVNEGKLNVTFDYFGAAHHAKITLSQKNSNPLVPDTLGSVEAVISSLQGQSATIPKLDRSKIGAADLSIATTDGTGGALEYDIVSLTLAGIVIPVQLSEGGKETIITFTALGTGVGGIGTTYSMTLTDPNGKPITGPQNAPLTEGINTAILKNVHRGNKTPVVYTVEITAGTYQAEPGTLTVEKK